MKTILNKNFLKIYIKPKQKKKKQILKSNYYKIVFTNYNHWKNNNRNKLKIKDKKLENYKKFINIKEIYKNK